MREDCRHFQSRTYSDGEAARFCELGLAPEAPWHCPADCSRYEPDMGVGTFATGSLVRPQVEDEPEGDPAEISALLEAADEVVNAAGPAIVEEVEQQRSGRRRRRFWRRGDSDDGGGFELSSR